jgi:hypothetical protein
LGFSMVHARRIYDKCITANAPPRPRLGPAWDRMTMADRPDEDGLNWSPLDVASGRPAALLSPDADPRPALEAMGLGQARPVIVVCGGADSLSGDHKDRVAAVLGPAICSAARLTGAAVVDGGTASGVMSLIGAARVGHETAMPVLLGVAPAGPLVDAATQNDQKRVELDEHHTHFLLADVTEWGRETPLLLRAAETIAHASPIVMVLAGGGAVAKSEAAAGVRRGWPLLVIAGTGGVADHLGGQVGSLDVGYRARMRPSMRRPRRRPSGSEGAGGELRDILKAGEVRTFDGADPESLALQIAWTLSDETVLKSAWQSFATYDRAATGLRSSFERGQSLILLLGVVGTLVGLLHQAWGGAALHWAAVVAPILVSMLTALTYRRAAGRRWVLLRAAAEETKSEIFRYRTRTGSYRIAAAAATGALPGAGPSADAELAARLEGIAARLMQSEAVSGPIAPYRGPLPPDTDLSRGGDDGLTRLTPKSYIEIRLSDQMRYYHDRVRRLDRRRLILQTLVVLGGGTGAILAAAGFEAWIGLTTAVASAALASSAYLQIDNTLIAYNRSAGRLDSLARTWSAHHLGEHGDSDAFDALVAHSEDAAGAELGSWVQQMNKAQEDLRAMQASAEQTIHHPRTSPDRATAGPADADRS